MIIGVTFKKQYRGKTGDFFMGFNGFVRKLSHRLDAKLTRHIANSEESLGIALHNRIALAKPVYERSQNSIGRAINWLSRERNSGAIEMNGIELIASLNLIDEEADIDLHESQTYLIPLPQAQKILNGLNQLPQSKQTVAM